MEQVPEARSHGSKLTKTLRQVLPGCPRVAIVAHTQSRADFIRQLCLELDPGKDVVACLEPSAEETLRKEPHELVVLDAGVPEGVRSQLHKLARERHLGCWVIEIRKWSAEPPA